MNQAERIWKIYWRDQGDSTYLYGSRIRFCGKEEIVFENDLIPPGSVIKSWYSKTNYQIQRVEPSLPLIDGERHYRVILNADLDMPEGLLLKFLFYQKNGELEGTEILRGREMIFQCPIRTFSYEVQLICAGSHQFHFHNFVIEELTGEELEKYETSL